MPPADPDTPRAADDPDRDLSAARQLFDRALSLPADQREAFVRGQARDPGLAEQVLTWLRAADQDTAKLAASACSRRRPAS